MSSHVFWVVSNAPSRTLLTMVLSASVGTAWFSAKRTELVRVASVGFVCLGFQLRGDVDSDTFLRFGQRGLVDCGLPGPLLSHAFGHGDFVA